MKDGEWRTPLGTAGIDQELAQKLMQKFPALSEDAAAHQWEHAIEVELPFLQVLKPRFKFVPLAIGTGRQLILHELGEAIALVIQTIEAPVLIVASSDMIATVPDHLASAFRQTVAIKIVPHPMPFPKLAIKQFWHERYHDDPANRWLRQCCSSLFQTGSRG